MLDGTNENIDVVVNIVAKADKDAAVKAAKSIQQITNKTFSMEDARSGGFLRPMLTASGKQSKSRYAGLWKFDGKYFLQNYKKTIKQFTDAAGRLHKSTVVAPFGIMDPISQTKAWKEGGLDARSISREINQAKQSKLIADAEKQSEKAKKEAEKAKRKAEQDELRQQRMELSRKRLDFQNQKLEHDKEKFLNKTSQPKKQITPLQKFINSFKRIGFYRIIRGFFAGVRNVLVQGIQGLADFDKEANKTISDLLTGYEKLKASIAVSIMPIIEGLVPTVTSITDKIVDFANNISMASAASKGLTEYTKISDKYIKDMVANSNKLRASFDKFETLGGKDSPYETAEISPEEAQKSLVSTSWLVIESIQTLLHMGSEVLNNIWKNITKIAKGLEPYIDPLIGASSIILDVWSDIVIAITKFTVKLVDFIDKTIGVGNAIYGIIAYLVILKQYKIYKNLIEIGTAIRKITSSLSVVSVAIGILVGILSYNIFSKWLQGADETTKKITTLIGVILALGSAIAMIYYAAQGRVFSAIASGAAFGLSAGAAIASVKAQKFAEGGVPKTGSMFIAGERGAELVTTMPSGKTGVSNVAQLQEAVYEALTTWWSGAVYDLPESGSTYLDGAEIARSNKFKAELNRTNPNLKLK